MIMTMSMPDNVRLDRIGISRAPTAALSEMTEPNQEAM